MKVAFLFWGLTRSLPSTINSIKKCFFDEFKNKNIEFDIYFHTYDIGGNDYKLLNPTYFKIDNQEEIKKKINIDKYYQLNFNYKKNTVHNLVCALYSQKQVTNLLLESNKKYDFVFYLRPDVLFNTPFQIRWFKWVNSKRFLVPKFGWCDGINDRFAVMKMDLIDVYGKRFDKIEEFHQITLKENYKMSSENFLKWITINYNKKKIIFVFKRIRTDGTIPRLDKGLFN